MNDYAHYMRLSKNPLNRARMFVSAGFSTEEIKFFESRPDTEGNFMAGVKLGVFWAQAINFIKRSCLMLVRR